MWVLLVSCLRSNPDKSRATFSQAEDSCLVTIQQARNAPQKSVVLQARGGVIGHGFAYISTRDDKVIALKLADLSVRAAGEQSSSIALAELSSSLSWELSIPTLGVRSGTYPAPGSFVGIYGDYISVVTPSAMLLVLDSKNGALLHSSQISDSRVISVSLGGIRRDGNFVVFCLTERGDIRKVKCGIAAKK